MQHKHLFLPLRALACAALTLTAAQAAELGDITPRSYIGQPLAADIELTSLTPEEVNGLQVRLAIPDVYRGANVVMNPALATVRMSVVRSGAKQYLHVTTARAVDADYVHVYVELGVPGRMDVRLATVWLQHDPNPAPPPPPPAVPLATQMTAAQADQIAAQARADRAARAATAAKAATTAISASAPAATTSSAAASGSAAAVASGAGATAAGAPGASSAMGPAAASAPARVRNKPAPLPSPLEAEAGRPDSSKASTAQALAASVPEGPPRRIAGVLVSASGKPIKPTIEDDSANGAVPLKVAQALLPLPPLPLPKGVKRAAPISCPPGGMTASECVALDKHNEELSSKITELEGKLKALQGAMGGAPAPAARGGAQAQSAGAAPHGAAMAAATVAGAATAQAAAKGAAVSAQPAAGAQAIAAKGATSAPPAAGASAAANGGASAQKAADAHAGKSGEASKAGVAAGGTAGAGGASAGGASAGAAGGDGGKGAAGGKSDPHAAKDGVASASLSAKGDTEMHAAQAGAGGGASASAVAAAVMEAEAASVPPVPTKKIRVLPKLKYKKEKPVNQPTDYTLPLAAGGVGLLALLGAGYIYLRKKNAGKGPLKIWQGFRKKKEPTLEEASPLEEVKPESFAEQ